MHENRFRYLIMEERKTIIVNIIVRGNNILDYPPIK